MTEKLAPLCTDLLAIDAARKRCTALPHIRFDRIAFPRETPAVTPLQLAVLSEVAYHWSDDDLAAAGAWLRANVAADGRILMAHFTGETDYLQTGDGATAKLRETVSDTVSETHSERADRYRLDLWTRQ